MARLHGALVPPRAAPPAGRCRALPAAAALVEQGEHGGPGGRAGLLRLPLGLAARRGGGEARPLAGGLGLGPAGLQAAVQVRVDVGARQLLQAHGALHQPLLLGALRRLHGLPGRAGSGAARSPSGAVVRPGPLPAPAAGLCRAERRRQNLCTRGSTWSFIEICENFIICGGKKFNKLLFKKKLGSKLNSWIMQNAGQVVFQRWAQ